MRTVLPLAAVAALVAGCNFDAKELEGSIRSEFEKQGVTLESITCPQDRPRKEGDAFECQGKTVDGFPIVVNVVQKDRGANWTFPGRILNLDGYSKRFGERFNTQANCGDGAVPVMKGTKITCTWDGKTAEFTIADDEGNIDYGDFAEKFMGAPAPAGSGDPDGAPE